MSSKLAQNILWLDVTAFGQNVRPQSVVEEGIEVSLVFHCSGHCKGPLRQHL